MTTTTTSAPRRSAIRTRDLVLAALAEAAEPVTVTELAERAGVGKSTLGKHLPVLEKDGQAVRTPGGREGRRRLPDTWQTATSTTSDTATEEGTSAQADEHIEEEPDTTSVSAEPDTVPDIAAEAPEVDLSTSATQEVSSQVTPEQASVDEATATEDQSPTAMDAAALPSAPRPNPAVRSTARATAARVGVTAGEGLNPVSGSTRLAPGELKLMVKAILDADPGEEFTATEISHLLQGRSIGAIQNNLARLATEKRAVQTCDRPRRYRSAKHPA
ncbi:winged helix-turn-helix domain-containing protein [Nocardiopsis sp. HUAS JQ3]|uniref:winged helix-turn-helix domain-containing protein n=1 Tax=Nocardiopsis sp. HUAS JQ3 TaxID=3061629 RepID=UPI0023A9D702|nr:helix-turn-helix domain-containing protein [Nocardiopsis sp. HUAS JQ3]WDZ90560.1 helix-turn-helix domain-containing protein [Nocardiopsis sp. HUAS JQ3]